MKTPDVEIVDAITLLIDCVQDAQKAAQALPGNNWPLRRALLECADRAIEAKRRAIGLGVNRAVA